MKYRCIVFAVVLGSSAQAALSADGTGSSGRLPPDQRNDSPVVAQMPLGSVMREIAYRFSHSYWAANGRNWGLAQYQLIALGDTLNSARKLAPAHSEMLTSFEITYKNPLLDAILIKDLPQFNRQFSVAMQGCNDCHTKHGREFLRYVVPEPSGTGAFLDFSAPSEPRSNLIQR